MGEAKDRAWEAQVTRQVTAGPRPWWQRFTRPVVAPRIAPPPELVALRAKHSDRRAMETRVGADARVGDVAHYRGMRSLATLAELIADDVLQTAPPESDARPAKSARHADIPAPRVVPPPLPASINTTAFAEEVVNDLSDALILELADLPMPHFVLRPEGQWEDAARALIQSAYAFLSLARKAHLDYVRHSAPERCCLTISVRYPAAWGEVNRAFYLRQLVPLLAGIVGNELGLPSAALQECIADPFADVQATSGRASWGFTIRNDDPLEDREVAA